MSLASRISDLAAAIRDKLNTMMPRLLPGGGSIGQVLTKTAATDYFAAWQNPAGGGGSLPLGLADWWSMQRFSINVAAPFIGAAVSTGTANAAIPVANIPNWCNHGIFFRSSATANSGYRVQTGSVTADYFGGISHKFRAKFLWRATATHTVRIGFHDTSTSADAVDGAYFEVIGTTISAKTANNSARTTAPTTFTLTVDRVYTFEIDVNAAGTSARFRVYENLNATPVLDQTITTNLPTTSARAFGAGIVATQSAAAITDIGVLFEMGIGTVKGFEKMYG